MRMQYQLQLQMHIACEIVVDLEWLQKTLYEEKGTYERSHNLELLLNETASLHWD